MKDAIRFGKYLLLQRINVGGMAEVFKAKTFGVEGFEKLVAIKRILPSIAEDDEFIKMFIDEAKITVRLQHANIAQVYELGKIDDSYFIAMEFINGKDLKQLFEKNKKEEKPMGIAQACYITSQLCSGLDYAHRKKDDRGADLNIIHRDVSPQNVRISYDGEVKVIDFGIAKAKNKSSKTEAGILKGKFGYMSPEQVRGKVIDRRSDIFAIGIIFYELLTGTRLFQGETDFSTLEKIRNVEIEPPRARNPEIPEELEEIVMKALTSKRDNRYSYAHDMHDDLQKFMILNNFMYSRTDLSNWMKETYSRDIAKDIKLLKQYENYTSSDFETQDVKKNLPNAPETNHEPMEWDDDELETQIFDKSPSFVGETPNKDSNAKVNNDKINNLPKKNLPSVLKIKKKKEKNKKILVAVFALALLLTMGFAIMQILGGSSGTEIAQNEYQDYSLNLDIKVLPNSASDLYLNGKLIRKNEVAPYILKNLKPGIHKLKIEKKGYISAVKKIIIPKLTRKNTEDLSKLTKNLALKKYGITYDQYIDGIIDISLELEKKSLKELRFNVTPSDNLTIKFDNKPLSEPYTLKALQAGKYKVEVTRDDYQPYFATIEVTSQDLDLPVKSLDIKLVKGVPVPVEITTTANTKLFIDETEIEGQSPYKVNIAKGKHVFKVEGDLYETLTKEVECKENEKITLKPIQKYAEVLIKSKPSGAKVHLFDRSNKPILTEASFTPLKTKVEISQLKSIKLEKSGFKPTALNYRWNKKLKQDLMIILRKEGSAPIARKKPTPRRTKPKAQKATKKFGSISIISRPATFIKIDGKNLGRKTPLIKFKLPAGKHRVTLYNAAKGVKNSFTVTVKEGKVTPVFKKY